MLQRNNTTLSSHTRLGSFYYYPRTRQSKLSQYFVSQKVMVFSTTAPSVRLYGPQCQIHRITAACMKNCSYLSCRRFDTASGTVPLSPFPATKSVLQKQEGPGAMLNTSISYRHLQWLPFLHEIWHSEEADRQGTGQVVLVQQKGSAAHGTDKDPTVHDDCVAKQSINNSSITAQHNGVIMPQSCRLSPCIRSVS
jgi:hypothetical protein